MLADLLAQYRPPLIRADADRPPGLPLYHAIKRHPVGPRDTPRVTRRLDVVARTRSDPHWSAQRAVPWLMLDVDHPRLNRQPRNVVQPKQSKQIGECQTIVFPCRPPKSGGRLKYISSPKMGFEIHFGLDRRRIGERFRGPGGRLKYSSDAKTALEMYFGVGWRTLAQEVRSDLPVVIRSSRGRMNHVSSKRITPALFRVTIRTVIITRLGRPPVEPRGQSLDRLRLRSILAPRGGHP
jgi:hypothetical protein